MTARSMIFFVLTTVFSLTTYAQNAGVQVDFKLTPGSFSAKTTKVKGFAQMNGDAVVAENIEVDINSLKTGMELRDKHMKERLEPEKFPVAKLLKAQGRDGKGKGIVEIKGIKKEISGTYKVSGKKLVAQFPLSLQDFKIENVRYMGIGVKDEAVVNITLPIK